MPSQIQSNNRILIPINFSKASLNLFDYGIELCHALNKSMMLLYVVDMSEFDPTQENYRTYELIKDEIANKMKTVYLNRARKRYPSVQIYVAIKRGDILNKVIHATTLRKIDQVLISTGIKTGLKAVLYDNVENIIKNADCSILLIPDNIPFQPIQHFLYATDYKKADFLKLKRLIRMAKQYNSKITLLHINKETKKEDAAYHSRFKELVNTKFQYKNLNFDLQSDKDIVSKINSYASNIKADVIIILKKDKPFLQNLFEPSITKGLVSKIQRPILIFHERIKQ